MRIRPLSVLAALVLAAPSAVLAAPAAAQGTQTYRSASGFTIDIPASWERLPDEVLGLAANLGGGAVAEAAFRVTGTRGGDEPFVSIGRVDAGFEITVEEFRAQAAAPNARADIQAGADKVGGSTAVGVPRWDAQNQAVWIRAASRPGVSDPASGWVAAVLHPSRRALIVVAYYGSPGMDDARARAEITAVIRSVRAN